MSISSPNDNQEEHGSQEPRPSHEPNESGHSGEGSASALAHVISSRLRQRRHTSEADAAGSHPQ